MLQNMWIKIVYEIICEQLLNICMVGKSFTSHSFINQIRYESVD